MSIFDRFFVGKVIKDFGILEEKSVGIGKTIKSMVLAETCGKLKIAFKWTGYALFGVSITCFELSSECIPKFHRCIAEAQE